MKIQEISIEQMSFEKLQDKFRGDAYNLGINKRVLIKDYWPDDPERVALIYVGKECLAVVPIPFKSDPPCDSYFLINEVPRRRDGEIDYVAAYEELAARGYVMHTGVSAGRGIGGGIVVRVGERIPPQIMWCEDLVFFEYEIDRTSRINRSVAHAFVDEVNCVGVSPEFDTDPEFIPIVDYLRRRGSMRTPKEREWQQLQTLYDTPMLKELID